MKPLYDYIIVGQGLAGSCLARELHKAGRSIAVVDDARETASSRVAAGMINPVVFRRVVPAWKADVLLPAAEAFYAATASDSASSPLQSIDIYKVFATPEEPTLWQQRLSEPEVAPFLQMPNDGRIEMEGVNQPFGGGIMKRGYWLDIPAFLESTRSMLRANHALYEGEIKPETIDPDGPIGIVVNDELVSGKRVIFCDGARVVSNPWFGWLPFKPAKGEVLTLHVPGLNSNMVINRGCFVLPIGDDLYRVGSTYEWVDLTDDPTEAGKAHLLEKFERLISLPYTIRDHKAGVRPTIKDRRPYLGVHPVYENVWIFNGLGTKGAAQAPWCAQLLVNCLERGAELPPEADVSRHYGWFDELASVDVEVNSKQNG